MAMVLVELLREIEDTIEYLYYPEAKNGIPGRLVINKHNFDESEFENAPMTAIRFTYPMPSN